MGDAEREIFWLGTALQSLVTLATIEAIVKRRNGISDILGEVIATYGRNDISGNLLTQAQNWASHFTDNYAQDEPLRQADKERFVADCHNWINNLMDLMKERHSNPKELYDRLPKIDHIHDAITQIQTVEHKFVCTSPDTRVIREKASEAIDGSAQGEEILLTGYFDYAIVDRLTRALRRGVQVRLIVPLYRPNEHDNIGATRRIKTNNGQVKELGSIHARLMIFGTRAAMVSSADPKTDGLDQNYEAGIWTTNRTLVQNCKDFFELVWAESADWNM
jgi:phosphatidylserine/phosphatidylglycerophosphate/cardiolipin synthase-like enzyme